MCRTVSSERKIISWIPTPGPDWEVIKVTHALFFRRAPTRLYGDHDVHVFDCISGVKTRRKMLYTDFVTNFFNYQDLKRS